MRARHPVRRAALGAVVLVVAVACGVRPEASPRVLEGAEATPRLPVPTVSQQSASSDACPGSPPVRTPSPPTPSPPTLPPSTPPPSTLPPSTPAPPPPPSSTSAPDC